MLSTLLAGRQVVPGAPGAAATLLVDEFDRDRARVALPRPEPHLVVRIGGAADAGLDVHVLGGREHVQRKWIRRGLRVVMARLRLGDHEDVLGIPASAGVGRVVALDTLWGDGPVRRLREEIAAASDLVAAAGVLERAIAERRRAHARPADDRAELVQAAAARLPDRRVAEVADELGVSERHLRRVFREAVGLGPKTFARLARFERAVDAAAKHAGAGWAAIAADAGYFDQAHLIADFRVITGTTPGAFLREIAPAEERGRARGAGRGYGRAAARRSA